MNFLKKMFSPPSTAGAFYSFTVKCKRCGETIQGRINLYNDPSLEVNEDGIASFICRKVLIGSGHCFQPVEVVLKFDEKRKLTEKQITGGEFVEE